MSSTKSDTKLDKTILYTLTQQFDENRLKLLFTCGREIYNRLCPGRESGHTLTLLKKLFKAQKEGKLEVPVYSPYDGPRQSDFGRKQTSGIDIFRLKKEFRSFICKGGPREIIDLDISNCHPHLLLWMGEGLGEKTKELSYYLEHKREVREFVAKELGVDVSEAKTVILASINGGNTRGSVRCQKIKNEARNILEATIDAEFEGVDTAKLWRTTASSKCEKNGRFKRYGSMLLQTLENMALECLELACRELGVEIFSLCFDGIMVYANEQVGREICQRAQEFLSDLFKCSIPWDVSIKPFGSELDYLVEFVGKTSVDWREAGLVNVYFAQDDQEAWPLISAKFRGVYFCDRQDQWYKKDGFKFYVMDEKIAERMFFRDIVSLNIHKQGKNGPVRNYTTTASVNSCVRWAMKMWPREDIEFNHSGWFCFENGGFNMMEGKFYTAGQMDSMGVRTPVWSPRNYTEDYCREKYAYLENTLNATFHDKADMYLAYIANAVSGLFPQKVLGNIIGERDSGKSVLAGMMKSALGPYMGTFDAQALEITKAPVPYDRALGFLVHYPFARIMVAEESVEGKLNGPLIKKITGGVSVHTRVAYGAPVEVNTQNKLFLLNTNQRLDVSREDCYDKIACFEAVVKYCEAGDMPADAQHGGFRYIVKDSKKASAMMSGEYDNEFLRLLFDHFRREELEFCGKDVLMGENGASSGETGFGPLLDGVMEKSGDSGDFVSLEGGCKLLNKPKDYSMLKIAILKKWGIKPVRRRVAGRGSRNLAGFEGVRPKTWRGVELIGDLGKISAESERELKNRRDEEFRQMKSGYMSGSDNESDDE